MFAVLCILTLANLAGVFFLFKKNNNQQINVSVDSSQFADLVKQQSETINKLTSNLPESVLKVITGSSNTHKGKLGELIGYLTIKAECDRIIPIGNLIDFISIKLPTDNHPGLIEFIDIKTGENARLSREQRQFRDLIKNKQIGFRTIKIDSLDGIADE
jgi:predicted Holliday junction resolvase-like endonuclease